MSFKSNVGKPWVEAGPTQCEMINLHHPDCECASCEAWFDVQCLEPFVGTVPEADDTRVCGACAVQMEREDFIVSYREETRFVIVHPEMGVYLGLSFWSKPAPVGRGAAVTFANRIAADAAMSSWDNGRPDGATIWPVVPDLGADGRVIVCTSAAAAASVFTSTSPGAYASVAACVAAGLEAWDPGA